MKKKSNIHILDPLRELSLFTTEEARKRGISRQTLSYYVRNGVLNQLARGLYKWGNRAICSAPQWEDLVVAARSTPKGVVCLISALCFYELTDQIMRENWIAIPHATSRVPVPRTRIVRMRNLELGRTKANIGGVTIPIFDRERTIIDAFRYLDEELAVDALKHYLRSRGAHRPDIAKLTRYAKELRVKITPYLKALLL